jgi:hypothetical protein
MATADLTAQRLRSLLRYEPESGYFYWLNPGKTNQRLVGKKAGGVNSEGYWKVSVDGVNHLAHRLVILYVLDRWPANVVDHRDGNKLNNRFHNLREANDQINAENKRIPRADNKSGFLGVSWNSRRGVWVAQIQVDGKKIGLGSFQDPEIAHKTYLDAKRRVHSGCTI